MFLLFSISYLIRFNLKNSKFESESKRRKKLKFDRTSIYILDLYSPYIKYSFYINGPINFIYN